MEVLYFDKAILDRLIQENPDKFKKCDCGNKACDLLIFDNGFTKAPAGELPANVIQVDFINRKRM